MADESDSDIEFKTILKTHNTSNIQTLRLINAFPMIIELIFVASFKNDTRIQSIHLSRLNQENVEAYVKSYNTTVWFGLNDAKIEGTYMNADGTSQGHFRYFAADAGLSASEDFFALLPQQYYRWSELSGTNLLPYLCQVSQSASPRTEELCGVKNAGKVLSGSDQCYAILDKKSSFGEAEYDCYRMFGVLAPVPDSATENEIREHIIRYGSPMDYWVNKKKEGSSRIYALVYNQMFYQKDFSSNTQHGVVCLLDTLSAAKPCTTGWRRYGDHCYLYTGVVEPDFSKAQTLCKSDSTSLVSIESEQENSDVLTLVKEVSSKSPSVFLGLKYNSSQNKFNWSDGSAVTYTNWAKGQGVDAVASNGECSRLLSNGQWKNKKCSKTNAHIVCKANVAS
ncbi:hypothetical protein LOTGIDRAFT_228277 [Lottia gigantea]|uniref:C-type lectin domain-containing protein n=1 Tax=Lottia gigantea TaxID=225164 RepID=V4C7J9_LOTGI|nr:hypothetical protein LOTGIDRAFT_228277 [Lottia gigantea]ESO97674.1 hypothetical protein LOTGIDRAFT_228277 [Lottia gigantea]